MVLNNTRPTVVSMIAPGLLFDIFVAFQFAVLRGSLTLMRAWVSIFPSE